MTTKQSVADGPRGPPARPRPERRRTGMYPGRRRRRIHPCDSPRPGRRVMSRHPRAGGRRRCRRRRLGTGAGEQHLCSLFSLVFRVTRTAFPSLLSVSTLYIRYAGVRCYRFKAPPSGAALALSVSTRPRVGKRCR